MKVKELIKKMKTNYSMKDFDKKILLTFFIIATIIFVYAIFRACSMFGNINSDSPAVSGVMSFVYVFLLPFLISPSVLAAALLLDRNCYNYYRVLIFISSILLLCSNVFSYILNSSGGITYNIWHIISISFSALLILICAIILKKKEYK